jgi:hypothetical protein
MALSTASPLDAERARSSLSFEERAAIKWMINNARRERIGRDVLRDGIHKRVAMYEDGCRCAGCVGAWDAARKRRLRRLNVADPSLYPGFS